MPRPDLETNVWAEVVTLTVTEWVRSLLGRSCVCVCGRERSKPKGWQAEEQQSSLRLRNDWQNRLACYKQQDFPLGAPVAFGLAESRAFFANQQVVSMRIPGLCHPFLLLKEKKKSCKALNNDSPLRPEGKLFTLFANIPLHTLEEEEQVIDSEEGVWFGKEKWNDKQLQSFCRESGKGRGVSFASLASKWGWDRNIPFKRWKGVGSTSYIFCIP